MGQGRQVFWREGELTEGAAATKPQGGHMILPRRQFLGLATGGAGALAVISSRARAQAYPSRPVRILVVFGCRQCT